MQDESPSSNAVRESSDTSDNLSDTALKSETGDLSLPNGIPPSGINRTKDVSFACSL